MIPKQLQKENFRFILCNGKIPIEQDWTTTNKYTYNDETLKKHIGQKNNYGVVCGLGNLVVLDFDNAEFHEEVKHTLPETFIVKSASKGLPHYYYFSKNTESLKIQSKLDIQGKNRQVIGPNSSINNKKYEVINNTDIAWLPDEALNFLKNKSTKHNTSYKETIEKGVNEGSRNNDLFKLACSNKSRGVSDKVTLEQIRIINKKSNEPLDEKEVNNLVISAYKYEGDQDKKKISSNLGIFTNYLELAERFLEVTPLYYDEAKLWWMWNTEKNAWEITDETDILNEVDEHLHSINTVSSSTKNQIVESLKRKSRKNKPREIPKTWIQFKDFIVDIETDEKITPTPKYFTLNPIPWSLGETEETPNIDRIFREWVGGEYVRTLYEIIAYSILPDYPIHRIFCFVGSGMNGKSKFLELLNRFIGEHNTTTTELDTLLTSRFEITRLHKKLICLMGETDFSTMKRTSIIKKLTGQDRIGFEYKNKDPFDDYNYAKILIATNNLPITEDKTIGFYRRWLIIDFPNEFTEKKDILAEIPINEYENLALKSIRILKELLKEREFTNEGNLEQRQKKFEDKSNSVKKFIETQCEINPGNEVYFSAFYSEFIKYCSKHKNRELSPKMVGMLLGELGFERENRTISEYADEIGKRKTTTKKIILGLKIMDETLKKKYR